MTENQLVERCRENDLVAQRKLYDTHHPVMLAVCMRYTNDKEEAQDVLQEGFIKVFKNIHRYEGKGSLQGWIRKIMVNTALEHYRKNKKRQADVSIDQTTLMMPSVNTTLDEIQAKDIMAFIQRLPAGYRMVFNLYAIEGYSHEEIAEQLGISVNTSYSQYHRARGLLKKALTSEKKTNTKLAI